MKIKLMWIFNILAWICCLINALGLLIKDFPKTMYWLTFALWLCVYIASVVCYVSATKDLKKMEK